MSLKKNVTKSVLNSLSAEQFTRLMQEISSIVDRLTTRYKPDFSLQKFIELDYPSLAKRRAIALTTKYKELSYNDLNKDRILKEFNDKTDRKRRINGVMETIAKKYALDEYSFTLETIPLILEVNSDKQVIQLRKDETFSEFETVYNKLMSAFNFSDSSELKRECFDFFQNIRDQFNAESTYRYLKRLSPVTIFMFLKMNGYNITMKNLIEKMSLDEGKVRLYFKQSVKKYPEYHKKNRKLIVKNHIIHIKDTFQFSEEFMSNSEAILNTFWELLSNTTENVAAGTVSVLTMIVMDIKDPKIAEICADLGFVQSAVNYQIKNKIFKRLHIPGFQTVTRSKDLIIRLIVQNINIE